MRLEIKSIRNAFLSFAQLDVNYKYNLYRIYFKIHL